MTEFKITLRQHTPMIHFTGHGEYATIRGTDIKPRLDRFLIGKLTKCWTYDSKLRFNAIKNLHISLKNEKYDFKKLLVKNGTLEQPALNYQLKVEPGDIDVLQYKTISSFKSFHQVFERLWQGKNGSTDKKNNNDPIPKFTMCSGVGLTFKSDNAYLISIIKEHIEEFFFINNFGTLQSKGFGSFYPVNDKVVTNYLDYYFDVEKEYNYKNLYSAIDLFYKSLKSGINHNIYFKSMLWSYLWFKKDNTQWDKKTFKVKFPEIVHKNDRNHKASSSPVNSRNDKKNDILWRDLFGHSTSDSWIKVRQSVNKEVEDVKRFKSPILFKPIQLTENKIRVYFGVPRHLKQLLKEPKDNTISDFLNKNVKVTVESNATESLNLTTPSRFDFDEFFNYTFSQFINDASIANWVVRKEYINNSRKTTERNQQDKERQEKNQQREINTLTAIYLELYSQQKINSHE